MMSDKEILQAMERGELLIEPFSAEEMLGPCSVDLHLLDEFLVFEVGRIIDPMEDNTSNRVTELINTGGKPFIIAPAQFILASTVERIALSKSIAGTLEGRSSIARLGIIVHAAGLVNAGTGMVKPSRLTLEVSCQNSSSVKLYPGMKIVQIIFHRLGEKAALGYDERKSSRFVGLDKPTV
ncbi:MAG: dCTP deaminase [Promethearchaeati archaeon SRVP18_Atabeyarchaeia-1]